jgi:hypothetical protein
MKEIIPVSAFALVLETVKDNDEKFWQVMIRRTLEWSEEKKVLQNRLDLYKHYWALSDYSRNTIWAMIDALRFEWYLYKTQWTFPMLWITELWSAVIIRNKALKEWLEELNTYVVWKVWLNIHKKTTKKEQKKEWWLKKWETYEETLKLLKSWKKIDEIAKIRDLWVMTIEWHIVSLYEKWDLNLIDIMKMIKLKNIKKIKEVINTKLWWEIDKLKPIKQELENLWFWDISYFAIKVCIAMMWKWDI